MEVPALKCCIMLIKPIIYYVTVAIDDNFGCTTKNGFCIKAGLCF